MRGTTHMEKKIEAVLASLDDIRRAEASPYLYTRVRSAIEHQPEPLWVQAIKLLIRPRVALLAIAIIVSLNALVFLPDWYEQPAVGTNEETANAGEYSYPLSSDKSIYDLLEEEQP